MDGLGLSLAICNNKKIISEIFKRPKSDVPFSEVVLHSSMITTHD